MNNKKFLIAVLSLILLFAVSCDNENKTGGGVSPTSPADGGGETIYNVDGDWWGKPAENGSEIKLMNIKGDNVTLDNAIAKTPIIKRNGNTITIIDNTNPESVTTMTITFTSDTTGRMSFSGSGADGMPDVDITKKM